MIGTPPVEFIRIAAKAGVKSVSLLTASTFNPLGLGPWSLLDDAQLRLDTRAALQDHGIRLALGEVCLITNETGPSDWRPVIDTFAELGASRISCASYQSDHVREIEHIEQLASLIDAAGLGMN